MIGIYKITSPSNKVYIGQSVNIFKRWKNYKLSKGNGQIILENSFIKYGIKNHKFEIITECKIEELDQLEILYKKFELLKGNKPLFCHIIDGKGGYKSNKTKLKISKSLKGRKITWINKIINFKRNDKISKANKGKIFRDNGDNPKRLEKQRKPINQYDLEDNFIKEFYSIHQASQYLFGDNNGVAKISNNLNNLSKTCNGFIFRYK